MKVFDRPQHVLLGIGVAALAACGGGSSGGGSSDMRIEEVSNGFGRLLPYQIHVRTESGEPGPRVIEITTQADLINNVTAANKILPPTEWPAGAVIPSTPNVSGNHFIYVRFSQEIDVSSVLVADVGAEVSNNMTTAIAVESYDPLDKSTTLLTGRAFVGGKAYGFSLDPDNVGDFLLEPWVTLNHSTGNLEAAVIDGFQPGLGFPGTEGGFAGDDVLVDPHTFVFVIDEDRDLLTHETFPANVQIQIRINEDVVSVSGKELEDVGFATSTVGPDTIPPEVFNGTAGILPSAGDFDVDPETNIEITFTEPLQILTVGELDDGIPPALSTSIQIEFGPNAARVQVPFFVRPFSVYDLSRLELVPSYTLPGSGPEIEGVTCGAFGEVTVRVADHALADLGEMTNSVGVSDHKFTTAEGQGVVNAPVTPEVIYVGRSDPAGLSVIDLNGFGGGTGNPKYDSLHPIIKGNSNFPNNRNVAVQGANLIPPLARGQCTFNGGSEGVFTLTKDTSLNEILARAPLFESVGDMAIGHALDNTFNNAAILGCQSGGGNICATTGLKRIRLAAGGANSLAPAATSALAVKTVFGGENLVVFAPHPNPPPLVYPPLCLSPLINGQEPTWAGGPNLLVPGSNTRGDPATERPPQNLLAALQNTYFAPFGGPTPIQPTIQTCQTFVMRQQVGHYLYVVDRVAAEIVVLNSNRFTVIDRIRTPDPTSLAMSPNMDLLAVTNESADQVSFIDTDPQSSTFHQVVRTVTVGAGPTGIAWESGNEDIFVCNTADGSVTVLSAFSLRPRKILRNQITRPVDVALTPRQLGLGFLRGVYFGYIVNQDGTVAVFESGPDGILGWGFDDTIGSLPFPFFRPKAVQPDIQRPNSAVWIVHEKPLDVTGVPIPGNFGGALSNVGISSGNRGIIVFQTGPIVNPQFRNLGFGVFASVAEGPNGLSGIPVDIAFDNMVNATALTNFSTTFSAGSPLSINGKSLVRFNGTNFQQAASPAFLFLAIPNPGVVDVLELSTGTVQRVDTSVFDPGINSISVPNVTSLADFFRQ